MGRSHVSRKRKSNEAALSSLQKSETCAVCFDACLIFGSLQRLEALTFGSAPPRERKPLNQRECECNEFSL